MLSGSAIKSQVSSRKAYPKVSGPGDITLLTLSNVSSQGQV